MPCRVRQALGYALGVAFLFDTLFIYVRLFFTFLDALNVNGNNRLEIQLSNNVSTEKYLVKAL